MRRESEYGIRQACLFNEDAEENPEYLSEQLITYIGNKRSLLAFIGHGLDIVKERLGKRKLSIFDVFSGSGIVSRFFKRFSSKLIVNDLEKYVEIINKCYLANYSETNINLLNNCYSDLISRLNTSTLSKGFISELYAPLNDRSIRMHERVFYTMRNAMYLDTARQCIDEIPEETKHFFLAPLLSEASIHANTSGVFKGFYKNNTTGIGQFGGTNNDALLRIKGDIALPFPVFSNFDCDVKIYRGDSNKVVDIADEVDIAYLDPPYNQHPYGSNYFMLNLLADYKRPAQTSRISGIPDDWNRSSYNKRNQVELVLTKLVEKLRAKYLLLSFNSEGFISLDSMIQLLKKIGEVQVIETKYNTFRGSRNLRNRDIHVKEYLYLVEKY
jgi:adenine-specific DNA-methyltransferase